MSAPALPRLTASHVLEYPYRRSVGPLMGRFFGALREGRILGARASDGRVLVPPPEYDPQTAARLDDLVELAPVGVVESWAWVSSPRPTHPLDRPFAFALVRLDGASNAWLHAVDAGEAARMTTGMRVQARFREERVGGIRDLACFVPVPAT